MTLTIDLNPDEEARLGAAARLAGVAPADLVRRLLHEQLPIVAPAQAAPAAVDAENAAAIALLQAWLEEEATDDPQQVAVAERELEEFKRNLNANRAATGERPLFPDLTPDNQ